VAAGAAEHTNADTNSQGAHIDQDRTGCLSTGNWELAVVETWPLRDKHLPLQEMD
jgi:hypothetical protein